MSSSEPKTDWQLIKRVVDDGDLTAFDALVDRYQDRIFGVISRLVSDVERGRDLTQETFLKAFRGLRGFTGDAAFYTWLYRIARNVVTSAGRYDRARPVVAVSLDAPTSSGREDSARIDPPATGGDPVERLLEDERRAMVLAAVAELQLDFREVLVLRDFEDRSYEEIAELLEIPVGTVRSRLHRARADLKERLRPLLANPR